MTVQEFLQLPEYDAYRLELVRGQVVREAAPGGRHGKVSTILAFALHQFASERQLGDVLINTGFVLSRTEHTLRVPDLSFVSARRTGPGGVPWSVFEGAPDLAIEVLSPSNRAGEMNEKVRDYLTAGCNLVWVVDPRRRRVTVHEAATRPRTLHADDALDGGGVLPGLLLPIVALFDD